MARKPTNRARIQQLVDEFEPQLRSAFLAAVNDIASRAELSLIAARLEAGDISGALAAVHLSPAVMRSVEEALRLSYSAGGRSAADALPVLRDASGARVIVRFDVRNLRAENWLRDHSSRLVTAIVDDQRFAIRNALTAGLQAGINPKRTALDIVGRVERGTGRRTGGIIGLTSNQSAAVTTARNGLISGDVDAMRRYLTLTRRDRRFDSVVRTAIANGRPVSASSVDQIMGRYSDRLLQLRGETIARTETLAALNQSSVEAMRQGIDSGAFRPEAVTKIWRTASDAKVRDTHISMNGQSVKLGDRFTSPSGASLEYPGDPSAPAAEVVNCRCWMETKVDFLSGIQ